MSRGPATSRTGMAAATEELVNYIDRQPLRLMQLKWYQNPQRPQKLARISWGLP